MKRLELLTTAAAVLFLVSSIGLAQNPNDKNPTYDNPEAAAKDPDFAIQGEYTQKGQAVQVIALGSGEFRCVVYKGGLPGAGWDGKEKTEFELDGESVKEFVADYKKVDRKSPTIGAKPPKAAVVLFDGSEESVKKHWKDGAKMTDDKLLMQGVTSTDKFQDFSIHVEFRLPYQPKARGQGRGNSGLYYQGRYETQMLDSFGLEGKDNECGGLYEIKAPDLNMCLPPLSWQTYDADFRAARYDENGKKTENARITVRLNGVVIQNDVELPRTTRASPVKESPEPGPIYLQNHGNPVRYRNIWVVPRDFSLLGARPIIPGFERFYSAPDADLAEGGRLLVSDLSCTWCHKATKEVAQHLLPKRAPILSKVGERIQPEYLREFIRNPHAAKPGTTMPNLFTGLSDADAAKAVDPIVHFLWATGQVKPSRPNPQFISKGRKLFTEVGCVICHAPQEGDAKVPTGTSVPLANLEKKYTIDSLTSFLKNPHAVRPTGRMPSLNLENKEPEELAHYLLRKSDPKSGKPRYKYTVYHGTWDNLPDFDKVKSVSQGESYDLDVSVAGRGNQFGLRFDGFLTIEREGDYRFHLGSDDGSRLLINGKQVIINDGVHPHSTKSESLKLSKGVHRLRVEYFENGGEESLALAIEGPKLSRRDVTSLVSLTENPNAEKNKQTDDGKEEFLFDPDQVQKGGELFALFGCADCHEMRINGELYSTEIRPKLLAELDPAKGCLAESPRSGIPNYNLSDIQRKAITAALTTPAPAKAPSPAEKIHKTMVSFNCYACHARGQIGGPEQARNDLFISTIPEMGDEGRIPPPLDGVADKLNPNWFKHVMQNGAKDRPYMKTRMPKFGGELAKITDDFITVDQKTEATIPELTEAELRIKANGRKLVSGEALQCVKCHTFGKIKATGIQAIDLLTMTKRIREDWFHRYMVDPIKYRPGTRMPNVYPNGVSAFKDIYHGDPGQQNAAIWTYLSDGGKAAVPYGLLPDPIELVAKKEPVIYRNFIEGVSPRGIAVGYPEKANIAYDADQMALRLIWHGPFIDAGKHWRGRGQGNQIPLGDHVLPLESTAPLALLESEETAWPTTPPKDRGYKFFGYSLDQNRRPVFRYSFGGIQVEDRVVPVAVESRESDLKRTVVISSKDNSPSVVFFRAADGKSIEALDDKWYKVTNSTGTYRLKVETTDAKPVIRESGGKQEMLIELKVGAEPTKLSQHISW